MDGQVCFYRQSFADPVKPQRSTTGSMFIKFCLQWSHHQTSPGLKKQREGPSSSFSPTSPYKFSHNSAIVGSIGKWFAPSCSSRDSASGDILVIDIFQNGGSHDEDRSRFFDINNIQHSSLHN